MIISKKTIAVFACLLLLAGCAYAGGEGAAGTADTVSAEETGETEENTGMTDGETGGETDGAAEEAAGEAEEVTQETEACVPAVQHYEQNDAYKLFYGTWEITKIVSEHGLYRRTEGCEDILGMQVTYLPDRYEFGGIVTVDHPNYLISIYSDGITLLSGLRQVEVSGEDAFLPENDAFVWVEIVDKPSGVEDGMSYGFEPYIGSEFFIKDDNTLYCFDYYCFYEMKRVSYDEVSEEAAESVPRNHHYRQNEAYKLFYGTWEITDIVSESRYSGGDEGCEDLLGMQVTYLSNSCNFGGMETAGVQEYLIYILPADSRLLFDQRQASMDALLPDSGYYIWVQTADSPVGEGFFIKDDNTLYLRAYNCIYEMKRVSHIYGYDRERTQAYHERW